MENNDSILKFMNAFLVMVDMGKEPETVEEREAKVKSEERIVFATMKSLIPDWEKPKDWDSHSLEKKEELIAKVKKECQGEK